MGPGPTAIPPSPSYTQLYPPDLWKIFQQARAFETATPQYAAETRGFRLRWSATQSNAASPLHSPGVWNRRSAAWRRRGFRWIKSRPTILRGGGRPHMRGLASPNSFWRDAQFDTIRLCLAAIGVW